MDRIKNKEARDYVQRKWEFVGSNMYAKWENDDLYIVYSYGEHFPMYVYKKGQWYGNNDKYSVTTTTQQNQTNPFIEDMIWKSTQDLQEIIRS